MKSRGDLQFAYEKLFIIHDVCQCVGVFVGCEVRLAVCVC